MSVRFTVIIQQEENWYVAKCLENSVASQGKTMDEALASLREALALYCEGEEFMEGQPPVFVTTQIIS